MEQNFILLISNALVKRYLLNTLTFGWWSPSNGKHDLLCMFFVSININKSRTTNDIQSIIVSPILFISQR